MTVLYTLADARLVVRPFVDAGSCNTTTIDARVNEALERLLDANELDCAQKVMRISTCNRAFALPYNVEKVIWATIDGTPARIFGLPYQFLSSGPGDLDMRSSNSLFKDLADKGDSWPTMFDVPALFTVNDVEYIPDGMKLVAFSEYEEDVTHPRGVDNHESMTPMRAQGFDIDSREINPGLNPGEDIPIYRWRGGTYGTVTAGWDTTCIPSTNYFRDVTRITKPVTKGPVTLYAVDTTNNFMFFMAEFHPLVKIPQFRRYSITNKSVGIRANVLALVKMRRVNLSQDTDILPIDSVQALKLMCMAIRQENAGDLQGAVAYAEQAKFIMGDREKARKMTDGTPVIMNRCYRTSLGRHLNRGRLL
jgi:hypothetical protein